MKFLAHNPSFFFFFKFLHDIIKCSNSGARRSLRPNCAFDNIITNLKRKRHSPLSELSHAPIRTACDRNISIFEFIFKEISIINIITNLKVGFVVLTCVGMALPSWAQENKATNLKKEVPTLRNTLDVQSEKQKKAFEEKMMGAAELYEKQFLREMVNAMRSTIQYSEISQPTMAEKIYKDKLYEEYVDKWSQRGGVGFRDIIYQQLLERYSPYHRQQGNFARRGPIELKKSHPKVLEGPPGGKNIPRLKMEE